MKKAWRWALVVLVLVLPGCGGDKRVVIDAGGIGRERDVMISEAAENTRQIEPGISK